MQELVGKGYEDILHLQPWDKTKKKHKEPKAPCITASGARSNFKLPVNGVVRPYTSEELEALQTLPTGYTEAAGSDNKRAEVIGDGWTVVVIEDLLRGANLGSERAEPMVEVEPAAGGDAGAGSGGGSSAAATQAMPPPTPVSPAPAPAPAPAAAQSPMEQQMAQMMAMMQQNQLDNQETKERLKAAEDRAKAAEEKAKAAEEKAKAATAKLDQVRDSRVRKQADRDDLSVTDSDKARTAGLLKGKKGVKPTPTVTDKRNRD